MAMKFPRVYTKTDFGLTADVTCQPSIYTKIGEVVVPAGQLVAFGIGGTANGVDTREVAYIDVKDTSDADLNGMIRLRVADPNEVQSWLIAEQRTEKFRASSTDRTTGFLLGESSIKAKEDSKLIIEFKPDGSSAVTVDCDNTGMLIPVTVYQ